MRGREARRAVAVATVLAGFSASGCGGGSVTVAGLGSSGRTASGTLQIATAALPRTLDPLAASTPTDELVTAQIYEPLVQRLSGPYGDRRRVPGLAASVRPSPDATIWRIRLRHGVRFQDGALLDASAVLSNVERWRTTPAGQALLPQLEAADAPRPDLVRLILNRPDAGLRRQLASPRLGLVSPRALSPRSGAFASLARAGGAGTGPFVLRARAPNLLLIGRNTSWWGSRQALGPALDDIELRPVPSAAARVRLLRRGTVQMATGLPPSTAATLRRDPLLTGITGPGVSGIGLERSVRGVESAVRIPAFASVWLTQIGSG